jgi:ParB family chromosome partitioning protein
MEIKMIPVDKIRPSPFQPRETFDKEKIKELADSIKGSELVQPILVRKKGRTYQIIAGERRWRAYQFAELKKIPAVEREADDIEARELSLIENLHRLELVPIEAEKFIVKLYEDGGKKKRYNSVKDMSEKTGIPQSTLQEIISANQERKGLGITGDTLTYTDFRETRSIKDKPKLRKQILKLREKGKLKRDDLRRYAETAEKVSEPVKEALLKENSKLSPDEAEVIDAELPTSIAKTQAIKALETERSPNRVKSLINVIKIMEEEKKREIEFVETDTGVVWTCPICKKKYHLTHIEPTKGHSFVEVVE